MEGRISIEDPVQQAKLDRFFKTDSKLEEKKERLAEVYLSKAKKRRFDKRWKTRGFENLENNIDSQAALEPIDLNRAKDKYEHHVPSPFKSSDVVLSDPKEALNEDKEHSRTLSGRKEHQHKVLQMEGKKEEKSREGQLQELKEEIRQLHEQIKTLKILDDAELKNLPDQQWIWHKWRKHKDGVAFIKDNGTISKRLAVCTYVSPSKWYYSFYEEGEKLTKKEFLEKYYGKGLVTGKKNLGD